MGDERGSTRMLEERFGKQAAIGEADIQRLIELSKTDGIKLTYWLDHGTPWPDVISGSFQERPELARDVVIKLLDSSSRFNFRVFPIGIPYPELLEIDFDLRCQRG